MITVFANDTRYDIDEETTLKGFLIDEDFDEGRYTINGAAKPLDTVLENYNVIEDTDEGTAFDPDDDVEAVNDNFNRPEVVEIELNDFTGFSGTIWIANNLDAVRERYNQRVSIKVVRNGEQLDTPPTELMSGDMLFVVSAGGVKGA
jgi:sulfur carrier protein ThiS